MGRGAPILPKAIEADRHEFEGRAGKLSYYVDGPHNSASVPPLLLIHSINAAGSAYEVKPIFETLRRSRQVYAVDLPGFAFADRSERPYTVRLFVDAVKDITDQITSTEQVPAIDALAISLSSEFLARAAVELPDAFRSLTLVTPTGFSRRSGGKPGPEGSTREVPGLHAIFTFPLWRKSFFSALTSRRSIRYFLRKTFGRQDIDGGLAEYDYLTTHQPGADRAPFAFVSGRLFSRDIRKLYEKLELPIWMPHGTKGDFGDFSQADWVRARQNWRVSSYETGALPHFEQPAQFNEEFLGFLERPSASAQLDPSAPLDASAMP
ncbi:MAG: alpha/beta hydrolase [Pseudomonadota bacterium]